MKTATVLVVRNIVVLGFLVFLMNVIAISTTQVYYEWLYPLAYFAESYMLPNYLGAEWARRHFLEFNELNAVYMSYYGWRRSPYSGETIQIDDRGLRRTYQDQTVTPKRTIAFFGGSTMWGSGADDDHTIPSEFIRLNPGYVGYNFGEMGYVAHQSFNTFLERYFEGFRPDVVVFYDGANDVYTKCQQHLGPYSHALETEIRSTLQDARVPRAKRGATSSDAVLALVQPLRSFVERLSEVIGRGDTDEASYYDCHKNPEKAAQIARVLLSDWLLVKNLVESYGGTFVAVLQPVIYFSRTRTEHLKLSEALERQYRTLYPLIIDMMPREFPELVGNFMDLRKVLDSDEYIYIDWCHVSPNGNRLVAERINHGIAARMNSDQEVMAAGGGDLQRALRGLPALDVGELHALQDALEFHPAYTPAGSGPQASAIGAAHCCGRRSR